MRKFRYLVLAAASYASLALFISLVDMHPSKTHAASTNVSSVAVVNTPNVTVANSPAVSISNTPNVNVSNTPTVSLLRDPENPARQPFRAAASVFADGSNCSRSGTLDVPLGKELVIEYISGDWTLPTGLKPTTLFVEGTVDGQSLVGLAFYGATFAGPQSTVTDEFVTSQQTRVYVDGGSGTFDIGACKTTGLGQWGVTVFVIGHLVDVP